MALFEAIEAGNVAEIRSILAADPAQAASRSTTGVSAVLWARYRGHPEVVEAVLSADPVLDVFDAAALGRLDRLAEIVDSDATQANAWSPDGFTPVGLAAFFGHPDAVRFLLGRGADVYAVARNAIRVQPLHAATAARNVEAVRLLLEAGADPDAEQQEGWTPIMVAHRHGDDEIVALLLAHGAHDAVAPKDDHAGPDQAEDDSGNRSTTS